MSDAKPIIDEVFVFGISAKVATLRTLCALALEAAPDNGEVSALMDAAQHVCDVVVAGLSEINAACVQTAAKRLVADIG
jgi:hypothetical protein